MLILVDWFGKHGPVLTFVALEWVRVAKGARVLLHQFIFKVIDVVLEAVLLDFFFVSRGSIAIGFLKYLVDGTGTRFLMRLMCSVSDPVYHGKKTNLNFRPKKSWCDLLYYRVLLDKNY